MPHIDGGTLHALLDGALRAMEPEQADAAETHLEQCPECRARLEEAAELRGRTDEILGVVEPDAAPDFEEVLVRAGATGAGAGASDDVGGAPGDRRGLRRQLRWTRGLAWAATIVIALGTGYLIRDQVVPGIAGGDAIASAAESVRDGSAQQEVGSDEVGSEEVGPQDLATSRHDASALAGTPDGAAAAPAATEPEAADDRADTAPPSTSRDGAVAVDESTSQLSVESTEAEERAAPDVELRARGLMASARRSAEQGQSRLRLRGGAATLERVAPDDVAGLAGAPLMVLPGAEVVRTMVGREGGDPLIVSLQRLGAGLEIRVTQHPVAMALEEIVVTGVVDGVEAAKAADARDATDTTMAAAPSAAARDTVPLGEPVAPEPQSDPDGPADDSRMNRVTASAGRLGWRLILEAPLPRETLEALAAGARPWQPDER